MEGTLQTIDRLIEGMNGEDPGGARIYMSQLQENETLAMLECFEDMLSGKLSVLNPPDRQSGSCTSMAYRVPPSEFLKVLLEGNSTRLGALHAVLQAAGRGDLQGRVASLCISEVRMCLAACSGSANNALAPHNERPGSCGDSFQSSHFADRRIPLGHLRELAGVCLSFSIDFSPTFRLSDPRKASIGGLSGGDARGEVNVMGELGGRGREVANNRRILMLDALPAVLSACCTASDVDVDDSNSGSGSSESDSSDYGDEFQAASLEPPANGPKRAGKMAKASGGSRDCGSDRVYAVARKKKKGKRRWDQVGGGGTGSSKRSRGFSLLRTSARRRTTHLRRAVSSGLGSYGGGLPERGEAVLWEVVDALLDRPWPPELALPLLVMFEEIHPLVEMLRPRTGKGGSPHAIGGRADSGEEVWVRVRSRLMECVWMGGMDGTDFTGVLRQVCFMCQTECHRRFGQNSRRSSSFACQDQRKQARRDIEASECGILRVHVQVEDTKVEEASRDANAGIGETSREAPRGRQVDGETGRGSSSWLSCLRRLHAAVPPECLSTVELVLEQTLHQMPDVAESLLDTIRASSIADGYSESTNGQRPFGSGLLAPETGDALTTSIDDDLALLLLLLREASPLRACSLPLLPDGADRGRRAEEGVIKVLLRAARGDGSSGYGIGCVSRASRRAASDVFGVREVLKGVLCSRRGVVNRAVSSGSTSSGYDAGSTSCDGRGAVSWAGECSGVASERASQLLELSLRWLEEGGASAGSGYSGVTGSGAAAHPLEDLASETISAVFDTVVGARPMLLRSLLSGVFDQSQGGAACAPSYLQAWESLMAQEAKQQCRRLTPHSQVVSDALGRLTLLPRGRARRVVESMLPLADACASLASALITLCRKCAAQGENKGRLFALHTVACIFAWNARRPRRGGCGGCLDQEGMREDLVAMFRRALEGGLQTATRADTLHLLASKVAMPSPGWMPLEAVESAISTTTLSGEKQLQKSTLLPPLKGTLDPDPPPAIDFLVLKGLRELLTARLFRFFAHKDDLLDSGSTSAVVEGLCSGGGGGPGDDGGGYSGGHQQHRGKGKRRARGRDWRLRVGRFRLIPLRLLEDGYTHGQGYSHGQPNARPPRGRGGVVSRDAIGHLVKCCWGLVPHSEGSLDVSLGGESSVGHGVRVLAGPGKRAETEAIARAVLGSAGAAVGFECGKEKGEMTMPTTGGVCTREGEALVAVVEFLERGGAMETVRLASASGERASGSLGVSFDHDYPELSDLVSPPACNPGLVGPLPALAIVVTLAEALVDCLLSGVLCPPAMPFLRPTPRYATTPLSMASSGREESGGLGSGRIASRASSGGTLVLWAVADVFTVLAAAARAAEGIAGSAGFAGQQQQQLLSSSSKARSCPETLSEIIVSLPAEVLGLSRGADVDAAAVGGGCVTAGDVDDEDGAPGKGVCGNLGGVIGDVAAVQCPLLSASSALVFVKEFLRWAAAVRVASAKGGLSPARTVAETWDAGIGVWLGLTHSVRTLAAALEVARWSGENSKVDNVGEARHGCKEPSVESREASVTGTSDVPSSEAIALVVFELRAIVGTPSAALHVLDPFPSEAAGASVLASGATGIDDDTTVGGGRGGICSTHRPPPGTLVKGFLKRMNERWKAHLDWGLPGAVPPRRSSARLESNGGRRRGGGYCVDSPASQNLRAEAEDSFFALRSELLRAQRLALSALLVGPGASAATRRWAARAALAFAERGGHPTKAGGRGKAEDGGGNHPGRVYPKSLHSGGVVAREEPEAGSGPACDGGVKNAGPVRGIGSSSSRRHAGTGSNCQESVSKVVIADSRRRRGRRRPRAIREDQVDQDDSNGGGDLGSKRRPEVPVPGVDFVGAGAGQAVGHEGVEGEEWEALGRLCRLAAVEMREGLENGLSVKLTQVYLDLVELLGNASLEHRHPASASAVRTAAVSPEVTSPQTTATGPGDGHSSGDDEEDAGGVLLSIITCHCIGQVNLFKRFVRGAVRYDGVGAVRRHPSHRASSAVVVAELEARDREVSQGVSDVGTSVEPTFVEDEAAAVGGRLKARYPRRRTLERCSRMLVHCVRWIRSRGGKRVHSADRFADKDESAGESCDEVNVGENPALRSSGHDRTRRRPRNAEVEHENDSDNSSDSGSDGTDTGRRYSSRPDQVRFETSRECYAAMHAMLVEIETALVSAGSLGGGSDSNAVTTSSGDDVDLASIIATVSGGLREFFEPIPEATTASARLPAEKKRENVAETTARCPESSTPTAAAVAAATASPERGRNQRKRRVGGSSGSTADTGKSKKKRRPVPVDLFPEHMKLLLMRVLERVYLVGRSCAMTAASALAKSARSACVETAFARTATGAVVAVKAQAAMSSPSTPHSPHLQASPPPPPPPSSSKRRRQSRAVENAGKPGDQAGGGYVYDKCDKQNAHISTGRESATYLNSSSTPTDDGFRSPLSERGRGHEDRGGDITNARETRSKVMVAPTNEFHDARDSAQLLLATILPALAMSSGDSLQLMAVARAWAEARRNRKRAGEDPCRKRASTLLFKMDRCELEIGRVAPRARNFLDHSHRREVSKNGDAVMKSESKGGHVGGHGGVRSAKKRGRVAGGGKRGAAADDSADTAVTTCEMTTTECDDAIERALRLLLSGADRLAAWRREFSARENEILVDRGRRREGKSQKRRRAQAEVRVSPSEDEDDTVLLEEESVGVGKEVELGGNSQGALTTSRRKSARSRMRLRSRNAWIDGWLAEGGEEGGDVGDAFVDLEDFIED